MFEAEVRRATELLAAVLEASEIPTVEVEDWAELKPGSLGRMLRGEQEIPMRCLLLILECAAFSYGDFLSLAFETPSRAVPWAEQVRRELRAMEYGPAVLQQLQGLPIDTIVQQMTDRLRALFRMLGRPQAPVERELGWPAGSLGRLLAGRTRTTLRHVVQLLLALRLQPDDASLLVFAPGLTRRRPEPRPQPLHFAHSFSFKELDARLDRLYESKLPELTEKLKLGAPPPAKPRP